MRQRAPPFGWLAVFWKKGSRVPVRAFEHLWRKVYYSSKIGPSYGHPTKIRSAEVRFPKVCSYKLRSIEVCTTEVRFPKVCIFEPRSFKVCSFEVRFLELSTIETRVFEVCEGKTRSFEVPFRQVILGEI